MLIVGTFDQDVGIVSELHHVHSGLVACVAAGLPQFGKPLRSAAEGVLGLVQWIPEAATPQIGPSATEYTRHYQAMFDSQPSYVAAQAIAAGHLRSLTADGPAAEIRVEWEPSHPVGLG